MVKNPKIDNNEINLFELMYTLWEGKWKIAVAVIISLIVVISYELTTSTKTKNFTAITEIKPISNLEANKFIEFNNLFNNIGKNIIYTDTSTNTGSSTNTDANTNTDTSINIGISERVNVPGKINEITNLRLFNLYLDVLNDRSLFEDAIRKFNLLEASQYNNEKEYNEAIIILASSAKILSPSVSTNAKKRNLENSYQTINFTYHDAKKWISVLKYIDEYANKQVKKNLIDEFNKSLLFLKNQKKYQLEDISIKIDNMLIDYDREISDRIAYLEEQSAIAMELGIAKNTIEVQTFGSQNALLSNVKTDSPFYLRGYEAINKEMELIKIRKNKKAFINGLFDLEKEKRAIEQDQTIARLELALQSSKLSDNNEFTAASINHITTKFKYKDDDDRYIYVIAIVIGLIAGIFYVLISNAFQSFRVSKKN